MAIGYKATVYVESGPIGHAFIKLEAPGQPTITVGYYPVIHSPAAPGIVKNDAAVKNEQTGETTQHPGDLIKSFDIDANQYASMVGYVNHVANHPGDYGLIGNQCTSFVIDTLNAGGISNSANYADFTIIHPTDLIKPLSELSSNQIINPNATLDSAQTSANINNIYVGISGNEERAKFDMPNVDQNGNVISGATATNTVGNTDTTTTPTGSGGGYMGTDGVYHLNINGTSTPTTASTTVLGNIGNVTQSVLGPNATAPVAIIDPVTGEVTGYRVTSFDGEGEVGGIRTVVTFNPDGSFRSGETQYLVDGKSISEPLDATTAAKIDAGMATANITVTINDGTPAQPATTEPTSNPTPDTLGTGPGSTGDILNNDSLQNPTYGGGDVDTPIISDDGYDPGTYIDSHDPTDVHSGDAVNGSDLASDQATDLANLNTATTGLNLFNTLVNGLQNWDNASDLARIQTAVTLYNQLNSLNGMNMPDMGGAGSALGFYSAYQNGDYGGMVVSGVQLGNAIGSVAGAGDMVVSETIGNLIGMEASQVVPVLGLIVSLVHAEENPLGVVIAAVSIACPPCGIFLAFAQIIATHAPISEGQASATFDEAGNLIVTTDQDEHGGGSTANQWMQQLAHGAQLAGLQTPQAGAYTVGMPSVGYRYNPEDIQVLGQDGKLISGHLSLNWIDANGVEHTRVYEGNGLTRTGWGDENSMAEDFFTLMQTAQGLYPPLMYEQLDGGVLQLDYGVATLVHATNTQKYNGQAEHTHGGEEETDAAQDQAITIEAGDKRLVQDDSQTVQNQSKQTHTTMAASSLHTVVNPVIAPIQTKADLIDVGSGKLVSNNSNGNNKPLGFVPLGGINSLSQEKKNATAAMIQSAEGGSSSLFGVNNIASTAMAAAAIVQWPNLASAGTANTANPASTTERRYNASDLRPWDEGNNSYAFDSSLGNQYAGNGQKTPETVRPTLTSQPMGQSNNVQQDIHNIDASQLQIGRIVGDAPSNASNGYLLPSSFNAADLTGAGADAFRQTGLSPDLILTAPKVTGELIAGTEDTGLRFSTDVLLSNDSSANAKAFGNQPSLRITSVGSPEHGQVALINGQVVFIPDANFHGTAKFSYIVTDQFGLSSTATASIFVESVNDAPLIAGESATAAEDNIQIFSTASLLANDFDDDGATDGQSLRIVAVQDAQHGTVTLANGQIKFVPDANYHGPAQFTYMVSDGVVQLPATVNLTITAVNDAPVTQDEAATGDEDVVMVYSQAALLANDSDVDTATDGDVLRISRVSDASNGTVSMDANGDIRFVPDANFHGQASYTYWVSDGQTETPAVMHVTLDAMNDAPVATGETGSGDEDATLMFTSAALLANDSDVDTATDGDVLRISSVGQAEHGMVFLDANGDVRFVPDANYNGPASHTYWVSDGHDGVDGVQPVPATVQLNILQVNDLPVVTGETIASDEDVVLSIDPALLLANDSDVDTDAALNQAAGARQTLTISAVSGAQHGTVALLPDGTVQFTPELNYVGAASFNYTVDDGAGGQVQTTAVLNLAPVNDAPDVAGEIININEDEIQTISTAALLANDSDVDNPHTDLKIVAVDSLGAATHGTVTLNANGTISYVPDANYFGPAQFTYTVSDGSGGFNVGTADLNIAAVNDAPTLQGESTTTDEDQILHISQANLLANDHDVDNPDSELSMTGVSNASHGTVAMVGNEVVFTPDLNYNGAASFSYTVSDGVGGTSTATVSLTINSVNDVPVVNDELALGKRDHAYTLTQTALLSNDTDVETPRANLTIVEIKNAQHGTATLNADHSVTFVPEAGYAGQGTFEYVVQDADGGQSTGKSYIDFSRVNVNPVAVDDSMAGYQDAYSQISTAQLLANDSDPDADGTTSLSVDMVNNAQNGTVSLGTDGMVRFTPNPGFYGTGSFNYRVNDGDGGTAWATGYVTVQKANSAPVFTSTWGDDSNTINATEITTWYGSEGELITTSQLIVDPTRHWGGYSAYDPDGDAITYSIREIFYLDNGVQWDTKGGIRLDVILPETTPSHLSGTELANGNYAVGAPGRWQYVSNYGDSYHGMDYFQIVATDSHGASTATTLSTFHQGASGGGGCFPVAIDTKGDGIDLLKPEDSNMFADINKDGWRDQIGWVSSADAVLAFDANQDGKIDQSNEVSFTSYLPGAKTDLEGLAAFDTNGDGKLSNLDDQWSKFGLVQDGNGNGIQDEGEFSGLDAQQIVSIDLNRQGSPELNNGNVVFGTATVTYADGHTTDAADVMFAGKDIALPTDVQALLAAENAKTAEREAAALIAAQEIAAKEAADKLAAEQLAIQQAKEAAEALAATQALEVQVQAEAAALAAAQQAAALQAAAEAAAKAEQEAALAAEAEIRRQALLFNQMANTSPADETPIAFVPNNDAVTGHVSDPSGTHLQAANDDQANTLTLVGTH